MGLYVDQSQVENRLSSAVVRRIADDNNDGASDSGPVNELIDSAEAMFEGAVRDVYTLTALRASGSFRARQIVLDLVQALAAKRFPRAMGREWEPLMQDARTQLRDLREGRSALDVVGSPEPAANKGGEILTGSVEDGAEPLDPTFLGGFGDF
jgi:hypothetical protein